MSNRRNTHEDAVTYAVDGDTEVLAALDRRWRRRRTGRPSGPSLRRCTAGPPELLPPTAVDAVDISDMFDMGAVDAAVVIL